LANGVIIDGNYHAGLFSYLSGNVSKITFYDCSLILNDTSSYYSSEFNIGFIAAVLAGGNITDVLLDVEINLGDSSIGETAAGRRLRRGGCRREHRGRLCRGNPELRRRPRILRRSRRDCRLCRRGYRRQNQRDRSSPSPQYLKQRFNRGYRILGDGRKFGVYE